jgi:hypothetical protein
MAGVAFGRIGSPENDQVGPILYFAERSDGLASQLGGYFSGAVSE